MTEGLLARLDRWIAHYGEPFGNGRANPDNDIPYLLRDARAEVENLRNLIDEIADMDVGDPEMEHRDIIARCRKEQTRWHEGDAQMDVADDRLRNTEGET